MLHTSLASSDQGLKNGFVEFSHYIQLSGLLPDFQCTVEVYGLVSLPTSPPPLAVSGGDKVQIQRTTRSDAQQAKKKGGTWSRLLSTPLGGGSSTICEWRGQHGRQAITPHNI